MSSFLDPRFSSVLFPISLFLPLSLFFLLSLFFFLSLFGSLWSFCSLCRLLSAASSLAHSLFCIASSLVHSYSVALLHRFLSYSSQLAPSLVYFALVPSFALSHTLSLFSTLIRLLARFFYIHADIYWRRIQFSTLDNVCCMLNICKCPYFQLKISNSAHKTDRHSAKMDSSVIFLDLRTNQPTNGKRYNHKDLSLDPLDCFFLRIFLRKIQFDLKKRFCVAFERDLSCMLYQIVPEVISVNF